MVDVEDKSADQMEERMVGIDLSKGVIMEIQIPSGKTCAKHKLGTVFHSRFGFIVPHCFSFFLFQIMHYVFKSFGLF